MLRKIFIENGLDDIEIIIVNSKAPHSRSQMHRLQDRVSFEVYQETEEEEVWSILEGKKDDMFVYDRCGRLVQYVSLPLSNLMQYSYVAQTLVSTYFRSPCGLSCDAEVNTVTTLDDWIHIDNSTENDLYSTINEDLTTAIYATETDYPGFNYEDYSTNFDEFNNTDGFPLYNETDFTTNNVSEDETGYLNSIDSVISNEINSENTDQSQGNGSISEPANNIAGTHQDNNLPLNETIHKHRGTDQGGSGIEQNAGKCAEVDPSVCDNWSKKHLLRAQGCCSFGSHSHPLRRSCYKFGKRRCKKMLPILKCCAKTFFDEPTTPTPTTEENAETAVISHVVCCREAEDEKTCRVARTGVCGEDEVLSDRHFHSTP